ncbi:MAG: H/ACA ribonucleoprotein complex subunit GAR1 [Candidatus Hodarchaeales archaeon]|jgi:rRNA processing protein Gar1
MPAQRTAIHLGTNSKVVHDRILFQGDIKPLPELGAPVFDSKGARIGKIQDIIGPVGRPWIVVKRFKTDLEVSPETTFYASKHRPRRGKRKKKPRQHRRGKT